MYNPPYTPDKAQTLEDIQVTIDLLYITQCRATKNALLNRLRRLLAQLTAPPPYFNENTIPVDRAFELPGSAAMQGMPMGAQQGMPMQAMPPSMPQQEMPEQAMPQQIPQKMQENIPPYIPQGSQQRMQMPPGGSVQQGTSAGQKGGTSTQLAPAQQQKPPEQQSKSQAQLRAFTIDEISKYDGKGNNPAYVAVNGMVYDVTDQPGWAAGSHFGLKAGLDQTGAYISCHTGQPMIDKLKLIGRLVK